MVFELSGADVVTKRVIPRQARLGIEGWARAATWQNSVRCFPMTDKAGLKPGLYIEEKESRAPDLVGTGSAGLCMEIRRLQGANTTERRDFITHTDRA